MQPGWLQPKGEPGRWPPAAMPPATPTPSGSMFLNFHIMRISNVRDDVRDDGVVVYRGGHGSRQQRQQQISRPRAQTRCRRPTAIPIPIPMAMTPRTLRQS